MSAAAERRARLEDERDVLLEQIDALDAELAAGQIDEADHAALKDDLVRRTAQVLRRLDRQRPAPTERRRVSNQRRVVTGVALLVVAVLAGLAVASFSGLRGAGEFSTGEIERSSRDLLLQAEAELAAGNLDVARENALEVLSILPDEPDALVVLGQAAQQEGDLLTALQQYEAALAIDPDHVLALTWTGSILVRLPDPDLQQNGIATLDRAIALDPPGFEAFMWRAVSAVELEGDLEAALGYYEDVLDRNPPAAMVGVVEGNIADLEAAIAELQAEGGGE